MAAGSITWSSAKPTPDGSAHWLPIRISHGSSSAELSSFIDSKEEEGNQRTATLRGRLLKGSTLELPEEYIAMSLLQDHDAPSGAARDDDDEDEEGNPGGGVRAKQLGKTWVASHTMRSITIWGHDSAPTKADVGRRCLDFLTVAQKVHAPVTREQVQAQLALATNS